MSSHKRRRSASPFTFTRHKAELNNLLAKTDVLPNTHDFWQFLHKYQSSPRPSPAPFLPFTLKTTPEDLFKKTVSKELTLERLTGFLDAVKVYLNFKQLESFKKLTAIRKAQKDLPIAAFEEEIVEATRKERVLIIAGDTGCGKSTQVPQFLLKSGFKGVVCTQPRRLACIALASRLKYETLTQNNSNIGYQVRFERQRNSLTQILFMTEGLLLRQMSSDFSLSSHDVIILDEVHERHLQADVLLGLLKCLLLKRLDLRLILMSATIDLSLFSAYFSNDVRIIEVPGRLFPVEVHFRPPKPTETRMKLDATPYLQIMQMIEKKYRGEKGDMLIFLSGVAEITCLVDAVTEFNKKDPSWIVLPLHSALSLAEQDKVFDYAPDGFRKCVISTNIAETSVTIDGIRFVVDSGRVKEMSYDSSCKVRSLKEFWVSRSSAEQRKGRAGRTGPGICYRVYPEETYNGFEAFATPEIKRAPLDSVLLQIVSMGLPDVRKFPFLESPDSSAIENCVSTLKHQNALSEDEKITDIGRMLSSLPVDTTVGLMLIVGSVFRQIETALVLASVLSVQSPYTVHAFRDLETETLRKDLESDHGDAITLIRLYKEWLRVKRGKEDTRRWCRKRGIEEQRFYEVTKLREQFRDVLKDSHLLEETNDQPESSADRRIRHGEVKLLKKLKSDHSRKPERKKLRAETYEIDDDKADTSVDIKDVEFRLKNDSRRVEELLQEINISSLQDLTIVKVIFCSGLYPQFAIPDEFNTFKSDQVFHTSTKSHVFLHPQSYFGLHPSVLKLDETEIVTPMNNIKYQSRIPFSSKHQILCYLNLLETTKIYLVNMLRMPAVQTFLLFSTKIETSFNFSRAIFDEWVLFEFLTPHQSETLFLKLIKLRKEFSGEIREKLAQKSDLTRVRRLTSGLIDFLSTEVVYTMKRLLPADMKYVYTGTNDFEISNNPFDEDFAARANLKKGGTFVTEYLSYNSVLPNENEDVYVNEEFECRKCDFAGKLNCFERIQHRRSCGLGEDATKTEDVRRKPNSLEFKCDVCKKTFFMTSIEILKHRKKCTI